MTGLPVLGDFLGAAHRQLERSAGWTGTAAHGRDLTELTASLLRFVIVTGRYTGDVVTAFGEVPDNDRRRRAGTPWPRAANDALAAMSAASSALVPGDSATPSPASPPACELARRLDAATASLLAGRDLLQTHFGQGRQGRVHRSGWAPVIASPAVAEALLADVVALGGQASLLTSGLPEVPGRSATADTAARRLGAACRWLAHADDVVRAVHRRQPVLAADRELLYAIPATAIPVRQVPADGQPVPELCEAVIIAAERARHAAWAAARLDHRSPAISVTSWRRIAAAGTAASSHCELVLTALAARAAQHGNAGTRSELQIAAKRADNACWAWVRSSRCLDEVTTDVRWRVSPAAAEAGILAQLTGRLASASSDGSTSREAGSARPGERARATGGPTFEPSDFPYLLAAVHHVADSLAHLAEANDAQAHAAVMARRILVPARAPATGGAPADFFVRPSGGRILSFLMASAGPRDASERTASAVEDIAVAVQAPSRTLAAARAATRSQRRTGRPRGLPQTQERGPAEPEAPAALPGARPARAGRSQDLAGPFEARLREIGVTSPRFLRRASMLDRNGQKIITEAATERLNEHGSRAGPARVPGAGRRPSRRVSRLSPPVRSPDQELEAEP
jgi:hypothetical protein